VATENDAVLSPYYKWILLFLGALCVLSFLCMMGVSVAFDPLTKGQETFCATCDWIVKLTIGGFFGMIGGKAL